MNSKLVKERINFYKEQKKLVESNNFKFVPFYGFNALQKYIPGIIPGVMYKITSHMGVGKTQLAKYLFVYQPIFYAIKNNINFKVIYFALEESKEEFLDSLFIHILKRVFKVQLDRFSLTGTSLNTLSKAELEKIEEAEKLMEKIVRNIEVVDNKYKPSEMFNTCKYYAKRWGKFIIDSQGNETNYIPNDPNQITLVVSDHISLLESEYDKDSDRFLDDRKTISKWHTHYCKRILTKEWNWAALNIQQQSLDSEKQQFTNKGDTIINKILPSLDGLANNKEVGRDDYVVLGLFAPERYSIENFRGYDIVKNTPESFGDRFRSLHLLKNRFGHPNKVLPLYFDGRYNYFKEMCLPNDSSITYFHNLLKS